MKRKRNTVNIGIVKVKEQFFFMDFDKKTLSMVCRRVLWRIEQPCYQGVFNVLPEDELRLTALDEIGGKPSWKRDSTFNICPVAKRDFIG